ncbi:MAG: RnfABCDGE type electron transport complex subunit A [Candidatus Abyssobacteria bacterium SURF_17]|uniref:Ion-translocating oxidoreductase complex subunit A n=1 Tax=Candidatus Abyssobacteria bacterium SURF_17 TaxID=2093361 RepID=A0A419F1I3_9BACT|nr:MAG: RnfABCDGE type electron transport complex subunit A [Candidatus Abyssubacteria bacterium SURF_17]
MTIAIGAIFINNFVLSRFLGICPFVGVSKSVESSVGMGMAVIFVMTLAGVATYYVNKVLALSGIEFLQTLSFILVIAALVQFVEMFLQKFNPALYSALGIYLPLITTNCAVLGVSLLNIKEGYNIIEVIVFSLCAAVGFALALVIMAGIRERLEITDVPRSMEGAPIAFIVAGILSLAFMGFSGMKF